MKQAMRAYALSAVLCAAAAPVAAQDVGAFDAALSYSARHTENESDNDIIRLTTGYTWAALDGGLRTALELGVRNEDFSGDYPAVLGLEVDFGRRVGNMRYGIGGRVRSADDLSTTGELLYGIERFGNALDLRGVLGLQGIGDADQVSGRSSALGMALGEANIWFTDNWVGSGGLQGDTDGLLYMVGTEYRPTGRRWSFFLEWGHAVNEYRGLEGYNDLTGGFRFVPGGQTLKSYRRKSLARLFFVPVEVQ